MATTEIKKQQRPALGKGLSSLLAIEPADQRTGGVPIKADSDIPRKNIVPNPFQPRIDFNEDLIGELAESIKIQGLLQPIVVRKVGDGEYQIISGERRFRAMGLLGWEKVPVLLRNDVNDTQMLELALVENLQRENLNEIETAMSYQKLLDTCGLSHQELSEQVGKSRSAITNTLRLLKLPAALQQMVRENLITMGHARALLGCIDTAQQIKIAEEIVRVGLSVRNVEERVSQEKVGSTPSSKKSKLTPALFVETEEKIRNKTGLVVHLSGSSAKKGKFEIPFASVEQFEKICSLLGKS